MMKKSLLILIILCGLITKSYSSDSIKNLVIISNDKSGFNDFSIKYGRKISDNYWIKFGVIYSGSYQIDDPKNSGSYKTINEDNNLGFLIGVDKVILTKMKNIDFVFGTNMRFYLIKLSETTDNPVIPEKFRVTTNNYYNLGIGFNLAIYYSLSDNFSIGSEINPSILYNYHDDNYLLRKKIGFTYQFNNISLISLRYRW
jgi:hypothetical protein